jgi:DNA polymerase I-like protein with 3'-5' exonuclease and polymerase domains
VALDLLAIDCETTGVDWHDEAFMISMAAYEYTHVESDDKKEHGKVETLVFDKRICNATNWKHFISVVEENLIACNKIIMHNAKFDIQKLCRLGIPFSVFENKFEDTQALAHLINEQQSTSLKYLARTVLGEETDEDEVLKVWRRKNKIKKEEGYEPIPHEILAPYALKDAEFTLRLYEVLWNRLPKDLHSLYVIEKDLTQALLGIEAKGLKINRSYVKKQRQEYGDKIYKTKARIAELSGAEFNPQSPAQVLEALEVRGISVKKTDKATLASVDDELASLIVELREANKIKTTYFDGLDNEAKDGILHPNFRQHGTRTGRMSSGAAEA